MKQDFNRRGIWPAVKKDNSGFWVGLTVVVIIMLVAGVAVLLNRLP